MAPTKDQAPALIKPTRRQMAAMGLEVSTSAQGPSVLPTSNGLPSEARAATLFEPGIGGTGAIARAQMSVALQQNLGNARMGEMLRTVSPAAAKPATPAPQPAPTRAPPTPQPAPAAAPVAAVPVIAPQPTPAAAPAASQPPATSAAAPAVPPAHAPAAHAGKHGGAPAPASTAAPAEAASEAPAGPAPKPAAKHEGAAKPGAAAAHAGEPGAAPPAGEPAGAAAAKGGGKGGKTIELKMPEPPSDASPATKARIHKVQGAAGHAAAAHAALPPATATVGQARAAVTEPPQEASAKAQQDLVNALGERPKPSPEIEALCEQIRQVIHDKRPPDEDSLVKADPAEMARSAGNQLNQNVQGDTNRVSQSYDPLQQQPQGGPQQPGKPLDAPPESVPAPAVDATQATPDAVPPENVSLDADAADSEKQMDDAGMNTEAAKLVKTGPIADAKQAQGDLEKTAKEDPAKVLAGQKESLAKAGADMAALQESALAALAASRKTTVSGTTGQQKQMVGSEEDMRTQASAQATEIFSSAQKKVEAQLLPLPKTAMDLWDKGKDVAAEEFKQHLKKVEDWIKDRHSGGWGAVVSLWDDVTGLPGWVTDEYDAAEKKFGDDICKLARDISTQVNGVIMVCEAIIQDARTKIAAVFASLPASLQAWATGEQGKFETQLNGLHQRATQTRDNFNKELVSKASQAVQDVREQIHALREAAKGLIGKIRDAIEAFIKDPVKFIIEGLLQILGIPPASFWAVVAKIQKVVKDIADDPLKFAKNLMKALGQGFKQFFDNILDHLLKGFINWLTGGLAQAGVELPKDASPKSIVTFILQLMGITWPRIRKLLAKHIGEKNVALIEKAWSIVANLIALGPEGVFEMIKEKLNPAEILKQVIHAAIDYLVKSVIKAVTVRVLLLFNPVGAILEALEAIYHVLKWIFVNAARIFHLVETVVNGIADIIAGNIGGMANAVEMALAGLIPPVIDFLADYLGVGDLPEKIRDTIIGFQEWVEGILDQVIGWLVEKGKALLAAVGLGGDKDKDKKEGEEADVGEKVPFEAKGEGHSLWIDVQGATAVLMVASAKKMTIEERLDLWEQKEDAPPEAKGLIAQARPLITKTDQTAESLIKASQESSKDENAPAPEAGKHAELTEEEKQLADILKQLFEIFSPSIMKLIGKVLVTRGDPDQRAGDAVDGVKLPPEGYDMPLVKNKRIHIQRKSVEEGHPEVHLDKEGVLQLGPKKSSPEDEELIESYKKVLKALSIDPPEDIEEADAYRDKMRDLIVGRSPAIAIDELNQKVLLSTDLNSALRGMIFDTWCTRVLKIARKPAPIFEHLSLDKERRIADGTDFEGNVLIDFKVRQADSKPSPSDEDQMVDYAFIIIMQLKAVNAADGAYIGPFKRVRYIFNDAVVAGLWSIALRKHLGMDVEIQSV